MNHKELYAWLVEELWGSFGYNSPEEHARVILNFISKNLIEEFQSDFEEVVRYFKLDGHLIATKRRKWEERKDAN